METGILTIKNIVFAGLSILGIMLLVIIGIGISKMLEGDTGMMTIITITITGSIMIFSGYVVLDKIATIYSPDEEGNTIMSRYITNERICFNESLPCQTTNLTDDDITIYWEVFNGVGCCNSFNCNYQAFVDFCGSPYSGNFKLYDIYLDGEKYIWPETPIYDYECTYSIPYEFFNYNDIGTGQHNITIVQKDCQEIIDTETYYFNITFDGEGYAIE
jgi:hypothetical protein